MTTSQPIKLLAFIEAATVTGPVKNLLEFARRARAEQPGVETTFATFVRGSQQPQQLIEAIAETGSDVILLPEAVRFDPRVVAQMRRLVGRLAPDIVQTHSVKSHFLLRWSGLWRQAAWVAFHHGYTATDWKVRGYNQLDRWSLRQPQRVVTMNQAFARELRSSGVAAKRVTILHNAICVPEHDAALGAQAHALRQELGLAPREAMIISVGRLSHEKAQVDLVRALAHLAQTRPGLKVKLVLVGEGPERAAIEQVATALGIRSLVQLVGQQREVQRFYAAADAFVLPSHSEGSPNVLLEAMAAALPIVATEVGGVPEIVAHDVSALLVRPRQPESLAEAMARLLTDQSLANALALNAKALVLARYTPETRVKTLLSLYRQLMPGTPAPRLTLAWEAEK